CHDRFVRLVHGAGSRGEDRWRELREATEFAYVLGGGGGLEAYALVRHQADPDDWRYVLAVEDWAALTPPGLEAVLGFVGRHGTLAKAAVLAGPAVRLLGGHLPEQDWRLTTDFSWMARGLDFSAAIAARPFPAGIGAELTIALEDPLLPEIQGPWRVTVAGGKGLAEPAGEAAVRLRPRAVGPLLMGSAGADTLILGGMADGTPEDLALLSGVFAAPPPVFLDFF
ncbi:MAG TPA: sterol carrier protein domain-containing protein, partial [Egibacteraceae bacterium]|nr:sterol carrier protein domain-containing protein [Egibacteraceae bacterium]